MKQSSRHHYIPQFLIKNFADQNGLLYVYKKFEKRIEKKSPKSIFYEFDRNTVNFSGTPLDNLEQLYAALDGKMAVDIHDVLRSIDTKKGVTPEQVISIVTLASTLKWRTPISDEKFNELKGSTTQADLGISIKVKDKSMAVDESAISHIEGSNIFRESKRVMLPFLPLRNSEKLLHIHNHSFISINERFPSLIGDCPIVEKPNQDYRSIENFIFPLSTSSTFIYNDATKQEITSPLFYMQRDLAILHLSEKYVACKNRGHLEKVIAMYEKIRDDGMTELITKFVFDFIG